MILTDIQKYFDDNGEIEKVKVTKYLGEKVISKFVIKPGDEFIIKPFSHNGLKNKDRLISIINFYDDEKYGLRANVKYLDNGRRGKADLSDLEKIK